MSNLRRSRPDIQHLQELYRCDFICIALQIFEDDYNNHCWIIPTVFKDLVLGHFQGVPLYCMQVVTSGHGSILWPKTSFQKFLSSFPLMTFFLHTFENWSFLTISSYTDTYFRSLYFYLSFCFPALSSLHAALGPCVHMYSNYFVVLSAS